MQMCNTIKKKKGAKHHLNVRLLNKRVLTSSMDWSSTILQSRAPTNESPAPVVSTVLTQKASTSPWKFYVQTSKDITKC